MIVLLIFHTVPLVRSQNKLTACYTTSVSISVISLGTLHFRNIWKGLESCEPCMHMQFLGTYINIIVHLDPNQGKQQRLRNHKYNSFLLSQHLFCIVSHSLSPFCSDPTISGTILLNQPIHKGKEWVNIHRIVLLDGIDTIES